MQRVLLCLIVLLALPASSYGVLAWPLQVGQVWEYEASPLDGGAPWTEEYRVHDEVTFGSHQYFRWGDELIRSTEDRIYRWDDDLEDEALFFQIAPVGTTWFYDPEFPTATILDDDFLVEDVYGGPHEAYKVGYVGSQGAWNAYLVPAFGLVQMDEFNEEPPHIKKLKSISVVPVPGAIALTAFGAGLAGWLRKRRTL